MDGERKREGRENETGWRDGERKRQGREKRRENESAGEERMREGGGWRKKETRKRE